MIKILKNNNYLILISHKRHYVKWREVIQLLRESNEDNETLTSPHLYQRYTQFSGQSCLDICEIIWRS